MNTEKKSDEELQTPDGERTDSDTVEQSPEFGDMMDDEAIAFFQETNPELLEIMKRSGLKVDDATDEEATDGN